MAQHGPYDIPLNVFTAFKGSNIFILFAITAAGVVPCGGSKMAPCISSLVQIILFLSILNNQSFIFVRLESCSKQCFNYLTRFRHMSLI